MIEQTKHSARVAQLLKAHPEIVSKLEPLEEGFRKNWPYLQESAAARTYSSDLETQLKKSEESSQPTTSLIRTVSKMRTSITRTLSLRRERRTSTIHIHAEGAEMVNGEQRKSEELDIQVVKVSETTKLKKLRRRSAPLPSIAVVAGHG